MESQLFASIGICILQLILVWTTIDQRRKMEKIAGSLKFTIHVDETKLEGHLNKIAAEMRGERDDKDAQETHINQTTAEVIKQVTDALEAISLDKTKDVKIIVSNDNINQGKFIAKLSFRPV